MTLKNQAAREDDESLGALFAQLLDDAGKMVRAELKLYRTIAVRQLVRVRPAAILDVAGVLLAQASVTTLLVALAWGLARWLGPVGAGVVVALAGLAISGLLLRAAVKRFAAAAELAEKAVGAEQQA